MAKIIRACSQQLTWADYPAPNSVLECIEVRDEHDSGELRALLCLSQALAYSVEELARDYSHIKVCLKRWLANDPAFHDGVIAHLFYINYSLVMHLGSGAYEICEMERLRKKDGDGQDSVNRHFFIGCLAAFSAYDLLGHLHWCVNVKELGERIDRESWDLVLGPTQDRRYGKIDQLSANQRQVDFGFVKRDAIQLQDLVRHKPVHGIFNYVVRRSTSTTNTSRALGDPILVLINPDITTRRVSELRFSATQEQQRIRQKLPGDRGKRHWDTTFSNALYHAGSKGSPRIIEADRLLRALTLACWTTYKQVSSEIA